MALSDSAHRILAEAARHPLRLASPPDRLPIAAARAMLTNLLKQGYVEECEAPEEFAGLHWHQQDDTQPTVRITVAGMAAIGVATAVTATTTGTEQSPDAAHADAAQALGTAPLAAPAAPATPAGAEAAQAPSTRLSVRDAAHRVLAAWDDGTGERAGLLDAITALRAILAKPASAARTAGPRKPREGTKQQQVLAMLRRPEGATVAQIAEATGWQAHTVRGFFAGLKKRQGLTVEVAERVRQVGPNKAGAKGSYTVYRIAEAG